jgi:hypothetical protein
LRSCIGLEHSLGVVLPAGFEHPQLGRDEQIFVAANAAVGDRPADRLLVAVGGGGVERAVAGGERVGHGLLGPVGLRRQLRRIPVTSR